MGDPLVSLLFCWTLGQFEFVLKGHSLSRAVTAAKICCASAPEGLSFAPAISFSAFQHQGA
jgi:hypothetical protein